MFMSNLILDNSQTAVRHLDQEAVRNTGHRRQSGDQSQSQHLQLQLAQDTRDARAPRAAVQRQTAVKLAQAIRRHYPYIESPFKCLVFLLFLYVCVCGWKGRVPRSDHKHVQLDGSHTPASQLRL